MANVRRGGRGGLPGQELRGTLGTLLKTTLAQAGVVRDVIERGAREGRTRLGDALANRRRTETFAKLGEAIYDLIRRGEIDLDELPEVRDLVAQLEDVHETAPPASAAGSASAPAPVHASTGKRGISFGNDRDGGEDGDDDLVDYMHPDDVPHKEPG